MSLHIFYLAVVWSLHLLVQLSPPLKLWYSMNMTSDFFSSVALWDACEQVILLLLFCLLFYEACTKPDDIYMRNHKNYSEFITARTGTLIIPLYSKVSLDASLPYWFIRQDKERLNLQPKWKYASALCFFEARSHFMWPHDFMWLPVPRHHSLWLAEEGEEPCDREFGQLLCPVSMCRCKNVMKLYREV